MPSNVRSGSRAVLTTPKRHFRSTSENGHRQMGTVGAVSCPAAISDTRAQQHAIKDLGRRAPYRAPIYFFDIKDGHRLVDPKGVDCLDDAHAISMGKTMARQIEANGPIDMDPQRHVAVINEEGQQIGRIAVRRVA
jgi:Domain of unknown function (DUF6894)